ncbi:GNAT family N-acetyltransferase [Amycolatopsis sp. NBC_01480]|uniref:GNAT family N-acetyltransferase n=1 Tax=Amycolatopsis sp. NBC_01480 TaxID=2903562 RepID=UPI002E2A36B4|nr:GNAT family N-acetyltransferase [Amycolatopsis sp. NBC_01480]
MDLTWRPLTLDDSEQLAGLFAAAQDVDRTGEHYSVEDLREELDAPNIDLPTGSAGAWAGDRLVSYAAVGRRDLADPVDMPRVETLTHPDFRTREIADHLMTWLLDAGKHVHEQFFPQAPLELHATVHENEHWYAGALTRAGYRRARTFVEMRADLAELPSMKPLPEGYEVVGFEDRYDALTLEARNETFAEHWGSALLSPEAWRHRVTGSKDFRADLSYLVLTPSRDRVLAFVLSAFIASEAAATGVRELYVEYVGTRAELRGLGIASALLGHTLVQARAKGFEKSALSVDTSNSALGVYERCGYRVADTRYGYVLPVG